MHLELISKTQSVMHACLESVSKDDMLLLGALVETTLFVVSLIMERDRGF